MAKKNYGLYLDETRVSQAMAGVVKQKFDGNFSKFMDHLLQQSVDNAPPVLEGKSDVIAELARLYHPTLVDSFAASLGGKSQPRIVARLLEALADALARPGFDPRSPFHLYTSEEKFVEVVKDKPAVMTALQSVLEQLTLAAEDSEVAARHAAEKAGNYQTTPSDPVASAVAAGVAAKAKHKPHPAKPTPPRGGPAGNGS